MQILDRIIGLYTRVLAAIAAVVTVLIMLVLMANVILRPLGEPIYGIVDIVQFMMLTLIMAALGYTQSTDSHIWVDVATGRFPLPVQRWFELAAHILTIVTASVLAAILLYIALGTDSRLDGSGLLTIPTVPFKLFAFLGFFGWALEALRLGLHVVLDKDHRPSTTSETETAI